MKLNNQEYYEKDKENYLQVFKRLPVTFTSGNGSKLYDAEGNEYIDALAGIAVNNVGHSHPKLVKAIQEQTSRLMHISNFFTSDKQVELSELLTSLSQMDNVFLCNSGAEAVEAAIKLARKYAYSQNRGGTILSFKSCFHGRTLGTIATGKRKMQEGFDPIPGGFKQLPAQDIALVKESIDEDIAGILIEPVQGEGGIQPADKNFLKALRKLCDDNKLALIFDEVQCGIGRTGYWFAKDYYGVEPDIMSLAKGLGGGFPIGAVLSNQKIGNSIDYGDHGTTFGGNPLACAAAISCLNIIDSENLLIESRMKGEWLRNKIKQINEPSIREVRGLGLMIGIEFDFPTKALMMEMFKRKVIVNATAGNVLRIVPPLNISKEDLEVLVETMIECIPIAKAEEIKV